MTIFSPSFVSDTRNSIIQVTTLGIPLAVEAMNLTVKICQNPSCVKENLSKTKLEVIASFTQHADESRPAYKSRLISNVAKVTFGGALIIGSGVAASLLVPSSLSVTAALIGSTIAHKIWQKRHLPPKLIKNARECFKDVIYKHENDSPDSFRRRQRVAIKKIAKGALITTGICGMIYVGSLLKNATDVWRLYDKLPLQTPAVVVLEYTTLAAVHTTLATKAWEKRDPTKVIFHTTSSIASIAFPISYFLGGGDIRLHHSFLGLALLLLPKRPIQCLGSAITVDAFLNSYLGMQGIERGEVMSDIDGTVTIQYDYQNALLNNLPFALTSLTSLCLLGDAIDYYTRENETVDATRENETVRENIAEINMRVINES